MKRIISLLLSLAMLLTLPSCGQYNPPVSDGVEDENDGDEGIKQPEDDGTEQRGEPFVVSVILDGKSYTPPEVNDDSLAVKVRWSDGKSYQTVNLGKDGRAECYGLDGEYSISLLNLPANYTFDPNIYLVTNDSREAVVELLTLSPTGEGGTDPYDCIRLSGTGIYRANMTYSGQEIFYEFTPRRAGVYRIESIVDVSANMYDPVLDIYAGSSQYKVRERRIEGGGSSGSYTTNFKYYVEIDEKFVGNVYTFAVMLEGKDASYPYGVDFIISYEGGFDYDWTVSNFIYPSFIPNDSSYSDWYENYLECLNEDLERFGEDDFQIASVRIDGKNVFDQDYFKLNPDDGFYHVYDEVKYAAYGGWGPILYANISVATEFLDLPFTEIEYVGNKALTVSGGTENYKLFIEGYESLVAHSYLCVETCQCRPANGGSCNVEQNCTKCTPDCTHLPARYKNQRGYADISINGRAPVTEELKEFLQKYSVNQKLFSDGNGWAEEGHTPRYDAYEDSQWLFACGYYTD